MVTTYFRGNDLVLGTDEHGALIRLTERERRLHLWMPGMTRMGKSRAMQSMVWQDIVQWSRSRHGLLLLDPDGETYDQIVARLAQHPEYYSRPVVLIDLRRDDRVIGYNLLKRRTEDDPAVTALNLLEAIAVAFGDVDVMAKPTLYRTAVTILRALIEGDFSLAHAPLVLDPARGDLRAALLAHIADPIARANLARINQKTVSDKTGRLFDEETLAFANRMFGPLSNHLLRHMFGQTEVTFDFDWALAEGAIVLVALATEGNKVSATDARMVGALLLADLWQAARRRGKRGAGALPGFYIYADEFQTMLTPTIAENLSRASGYSLYFILANQLVSQLRDNGGEHGDAIYHAVLGNIHNRIVFRAPTEEADLRPLTRALFLSQVDIDKVKDEITSYQVVDHEEVREVLYGGSTTTSAMRTSTTSVGHTEGSAYANGRHRGSGSSESYGSITPIDSERDCDSGSMSETFGASSSESASEQFSESSSDSVSESESEGYGESTAASWTASVRTRPIIEERVSSRTYESVENQLFAFDQRIAALPERHAYVKLAKIDAPIRLKTLDTPDAVSSALLVEHARARALELLPFALEKAIAEANLARLGDPLAIECVPKADDGLATFARKRSSARPSSKESDDGD